MPQISFLPPSSFFRWLDHSFCKILRIFFAVKDVFLCHCRPRQRSLQYRKESFCFLVSFFVREISWAEVLLLLQSGGNALESQAHNLIDMVHFLFWDQIDLVLILVICPKGLFLTSALSSCCYNLYLLFILSTYGGLLPHLSQYPIWGIISIILTNSSFSTLYTSLPHGNIIIVILNVLITITLLSVLLPRLPHVGHNHYDLVYVHHHHHH